MSTPRRTLKSNHLSRARHTPYNRRKSSGGCFAPFKSPLPSASCLSPSESTSCDSSKNSSTVGSSMKSLSSTESKVKLAKEVLELKDKKEYLDKQILDLSDRYCIDDLQIYIDKLHAYNEIKDVAQMLLGRLAEVEGRTTKSLYEKFDLHLED